MKITSIISQHRRDFRANMECEFCQTKFFLDNGYDDANYYNNVIPNQKCKSCGESTNSKGGEADSITPRIPAGVVI